jgi:hypothetical protein
MELILLRESSSMIISPQDYSASIFKGEGYTYHLKQGLPAALGVRAHEATNIQVLTRQAERAGREVVSSEIEVRYAYNPETGRVEVVGGRARVRHREKPLQEDPLGSEAFSSKGNPKGVTDPTNASREDKGRLYKQAEADLERAIQAARRELEAHKGKEPDIDGKIKERIAALEAKLREVRFAQQMEKLSEALKIASKQESELAQELMEGEGRANQSSHAEGRFRRGVSYGVFLPAMTVSGLYVNTSA